jgi:hypothetical protein
VAAEHGVEVGRGATGGLEERVDGGLHGRCAAVAVGDEDAGEGADFHGAAGVARGLEPRIRIGLFGGGISLAGGGAKPGGRGVPGVADVLGDGGDVDAFEAAVAQGAGGQEGRAAVGLGEGVVGEEVAATAAEREIGGEGGGDGDDIGHVDLLDEGGEAGEQGAAAAIWMAVIFSVMPPGMSAAAWGSLPRKSAPSLWASRPDFEGLEVVTEDAEVELGVADELGGELREEGAAGVDGVGGEFGLRPVAQGDERGVGAGVGGDLGDVDEVESGEEVEMGDVRRDEVGGLGEVAGEAAVGRRGDAVGASCARTEAMPCSTGQTPQMRWVTCWASSGSRRAVSARTAEHLADDARAGDPPSSVSMVTPRWPSMRVTGLTVIVSFMANGRTVGEKSAAGVTDAERRRGSHPAESASPSGESTHGAPRPRERVYRLRRGWVEGKGR